MNAHASKLKTFDVVPTEADVVIVGGGIVGMSTALFLARKGVSVVVCEKGAIGEEQSSRNWGWVRKMGRDPREIPLMIRSQQIWGGDRRHGRAPRPGSGSTGSRISAIRRRTSASTRVG
jgi:glycine/D-amino acid oxidase-like deaminating enzyme